MAELVGAIIIIALIVIPLVAVGSKGVDKNARW